MIGLAPVDELGVDYTVEFFWTGNWRKSITDASDRYGCDTIMLCESSAEHKRGITDSKWDLVRQARSDVVIVDEGTESPITCTMQAGVSDVLDISGQMFLESRTGANAANVVLTDGSSVTVDQLVIGGAGIAALVGTAGAGAQIDDLDMALIISTEVGGAGRRWITTQSVIGSASVNGYDLADINEASLLINSEIVGGAVVIGGTDPVIDWNGASDAEQTDIIVSPSQTLSVDVGDRALEIGVDGSLKLGGAALRGDFTIALEESTAGERAWHIVANNGSGEVWVGKNERTGVCGASERSGVIRGTASLTGVQDLTLTGTFETEFDSTGNMVFAGAVDVDVAGYAKISGQVAVETTAVATAEPTEVPTTPPPTAEQAPTEQPLPPAPPQ